MIGYVDIIPGNASLGDSVRCNYTEQIWTRTLSDRFVPKVCIQFDPPISSA